MRLKSFHAPTIAEAMAQVRRTLGDDAIIVATREDDDGRGVRVTAAIDEVAEAIGRTPFLKPHGATIVAEPELDVPEVVQDALYRHGVPAPIAERLMTTVESQDIGEPAAALATALDVHYSFEPLDGVPWRKPLMFVGPPGAGKTLVIAKLAARAILGGQSVSIMTTDTIRAGGVEQLAAFARVLKTNLIAVEDPVALCDGLMTQTDATRVLIDSMGRNPFDPADMAELGELIKAGNLEPVLVLPAGGDAVEVVEIADAFRSLGVRRVVVTRLDISRRLGSVLALAADRRLDFAEASVTPKVAEGLLPLSPLSLARLLLPGTIRSSQTAKHTGTYR